MARGDAVLLQALKLELAPIVSVCKEAEALLKTIESELPIIETIPTWSGPSLAEAAAAWRKLMDRYWSREQLDLPTWGRDRTRVRLTAAYAAMAEARKAGANRACALKDIAWNLARMEDDPDVVSTTEIEYLEKAIESMEKSGIDEKGACATVNVDRINDEMRHGTRMETRTIGEIHQALLDGWRQPEKNDFEHKTSLMANR